MTGAEALRRAIPRLREAGIPDAARDARMLLAHAMGVGGDRLTLHLADDLHPGAADRFESLSAARIMRQPISQIVGQRLFWGRSFTVTRDVLDPRPETESLVAQALSEQFDRVLDLGTGTGCILLTLLLERPGAAGLGVDMSESALLVAEDNRRRHGMQEAAELRRGSWYEPVTRSFDLIVSNPPYIAADEMAALSPEVRDWEPHIALTPGGDGLDAYRAICAGAPAHLEPNGRLMVEIGPTQAAQVRALMLQGGLVSVAIHPDLDGRDRVVVGRAPERFP